MRSEKLLVLLSLCCVLIMGCASSDDEQSTKMQEMPIVISLPAEQFVNPHDFEASAGGEADARSRSISGTRANTPGDPGTYEKFSLPTYLYIFLYVQETESQKVITYKHLSISTSSWTKKIYGSDSIYQYSGSIPFDIPATRKAIRVYAAAWNRQLTLKNGSTTISKSDDINSENEIKNITFDLSNNNLSEDIANLNNLYSSPCNYEVNGKYYGEMEDPESAQPNIDLMLYHVAAKLDLKWNVESNKQSGVKISYVGAENIKTKGCYLFKPMENDNSNANGSIGISDIEVGSQWLGRKSFYIIPYKSDSTYPVSFKMRCNDKTTGTTITQEITPVSTIFTPWIRGNIKVVGSNF